MSTDRPQSDTDLPPEVMADGASNSRSSSFVSSLLQPIRNLSPRLKIAGGGISLIMVVALSYYFSQRGSEDPSLITLDQAYLKLEEKDYKEAKRIALLLRGSEDLSYDEIGGPVYILGVIAANEAKDHWNTDQQKDKYLIATRRLEESRDHGFPEGRKADGMYLLGVSLFQSEQYSRSTTVLQSALKDNPERKISIHRMLSKAYLLSPNPRLEEALKHSEKYLEDRKLSLRERHETQLDQSRIYFLMGDIDATQKTLDQITDDSPLRSEAIVIRGRLLIHKGDQYLAKAKLGNQIENEKQAFQNYSEAVKTFRVSQQRDLLGNQATRKSRYLTGICYRKLKDYRAAEGQFLRTRKLHLNLPEGMASTLQAAEIQQIVGKHEESIATFTSLIRELGPLDNFSNPWISLNDFRQRLFDAYQVFIQKENYQQAVEFAKLLKPITSRDEMTKLVGEAYQAWAIHLMKAADEAQPTPASKLRKQAREQYRNAGSQFARLARLRLTTRMYPEDLWRSAESHFSGLDFRNASIQLKRYLQYESRARRPQALIRMGQCHLSLGNLDEALKHTLECIKFHAKHPATYRARIVASKIYREQGKITEAQSLLSTNLEAPGLTPKSPEWQDSLFALGRIFYWEGIAFESNSRLVGIDGEDPQGRKEGFLELEKAYVNFQKSEELLSEAVSPSRYPNSSQATEARYLIAESLRRSAKLSRKKMVVAELEANRAAFAQQAERNSTAALARYTELRKLLEVKRETNELTPAEQSVLRNCHFTGADLLFDLKQYKEAIKAYEIAASRFAGSPVTLEAYLQIRNCYWKLNQKVESQEALAQAILALGKIPNDADFSETTNYSREKWSDYLGWLSTL